MTSVSLEIGGNHYNVSCRDGEEPHLNALAAIVDEKANEARTITGGVSEVRQLLLASLLLADELSEARKKNGSFDTVIEPEISEILIKFANKMEAIATRLEN